MTIRQMQIHMLQDIPVYPECITQKDLYRPYKHMGKPGSAVHNFASKIPLSEDLDEEGRLIFTWPSLMDKQKALAYYNNCH